MWQSSHRTVTDKPGQIRGLRVFAVYNPTAADLAKARELPRDACPRRHCWWWRSLSFDWDVEVRDGCTFVEARKPKGWRNADAQCKRCDPNSGCDQYEPREPHLYEDGFDDAYWNGPDPK